MTESGHGVTHRSPVTSLTAVSGPRTVPGPGNASNKRKHTCDHPVKVHPTELSFKERITKLFIVI